jgi:Ethanolamine utilization protein EutJ (predicted chaperonin)
VAETKETDVTNDQIIVEFKNAAEVAMRLKAYAESSEIGGAYTEAKCAYEASDTIIRLIGIIAGMATPKQPITSFVDKNYCGHCG